jgi:hypothetical protein
MPQRPLSRGNGKRWAIAGGVVAAWLVCEFISGSYLSATVLLVLLGVLGTIAVVFARHMGYTMDHPAVQKLASRPWRSGPDVLRVAARHLDDVFIITPSGKAIAPVNVEVRLNPDDLADLCQRMDIGAIGLSMTEAYEQAITRRDARMAHQGRPDVYVIADDSIAPGRFRVGQGQAGDRFDAFAQPPQAAVPVPQGAYDPSQVIFEDASVGRAPAPVPDWSWTDGLTRAEPLPRAELAGRGDGREMPTVMEKTFAPVPVLRLVTGNSVTETSTSGHRAGRGNVELVLPDIPTISREHGRFTYSEGKWWVANMGLNGIMLNGSPVNGERPLSNGDTIRWGVRPDAVESKVEIG